MSATIQLQWSAAHAHVNLVDWASTAVMGLVYTAYPKAGNSAMWRSGFWLYNVGLPFVLLSIFMVRVPGAIGFSHIFTFGGGAAVALEGIIFVVNIFNNVHEIIANNEQ